MQAGSSSGADLLRMEAERKQKNNDRERRRVQIMNQGFDALKEVLTLDTFPVPNPKVRFLFISFYITDAIRDGFSN